jgi:hypothetical protein
MDAVDSGSLRSRRETGGSWGVDNCVQVFVEE